MEQRLKILRSHLVPLSGKNFSLLRTLMYRFM